MSRFRIRNDHSWFQRTQTTRLVEYVHVRELHIDLTPFTGRKILIPSFLPTVLPSLSMWWFCPPLSGLSVL